MRRHECQYGPPDKWQSDSDTPETESRARWCLSSNCFGFVEECRPTEIGAALWIAALALWNEESKGPHTRVRDIKEVVDENLAQDFCCAWARSLLEGK